MADHPLIDYTPELHGGAAHIKGKGVTVRRIVYLSNRHDNHKAGMTVQEIADDTHLTREEVMAAQCYYEHNRKEIDTNIWEQAMLAEQLEKEYFEKPTLLERYKAANNPGRLNDLRL